MVFVDGLAGGVRFHHIGCKCDKQSVERVHIRQVVESRVLVVHQLYENLTIRSRLAQHVLHDYVNVRTG